MDQYKNDFQDFGDTVWLNAASEGPLPKVAAEALQEAVHWKSSVYLLDIPKFIKVPLDLRNSISQLMHVDAKDVILGTSASYGLHILANGIVWEKDDEILVMENDFPTNILPWLDLQKKGVVVRQIKPEAQVLSPEEVEANITPKTRLICLSHVHTFSGYQANVPRIVDLCHSNDIKFVLNVSQSLGTMPVNISELKVDAVVGVGYKWLCGPYGTGFCWIKEEFRNELEYNRAYWSAYLTEQELQAVGPISRKEQTSARKYDVFGTANFFNYVPLTAALQYWLTIGIETVQAHNQVLVDRIIREMDMAKYRVLSPQVPAERSNIFIFSHQNPECNMELFKHMKDNSIYAAYWKGSIRLAPHLYNDLNDIDKAIQIINNF